MITNLNLTDIGIKLAEHLKENALIRDFCQNEFGKQPQFFVGEFLKRQEPTGEDTPYIVLCEMEKTEGVNIEYCEYHITLVIGVGSNTKPDLVNVKDNIFTIDSYDVGNKFTQLIIQVLHDREYMQRPIAKLHTRGTYPVESDGTHWATIMDCTWRVYQDLGVTQQDF